MHARWCKYGAKKKPQGGACLWTSLPLFQARFPMTAFTPICVLTFQSLATGVLSRRFSLTSLIGSSLERYYHGTGLFRLALSLTYRHGALTILDIPFFLDHFGALRTDGGTRVTLKTFVCWSNVSEFFVFSDFVVGNCGWEL